MPFASLTAFDNWIVGANANNMANMLSAQLAAMKLNVVSGGVSGSAFVYAGSCGNNPGGNPNFISIDQLIADSAGQLPAPPGHDRRRSTRRTGPSRSA